MADDLLAQFAKYLQDSTVDGRASAEMMVRSSLARRDPLVIRAANWCAVPRAITVDIMAALLAGPPDRSETARSVDTLFAELSTLHFAHPRDLQTLVYRESARNYLLDSLRQSDPALFKELHRRAEAYFDARLEAIGRPVGATSLITQTHLGLIREKAYHLLFVDAVAGYRYVDTVLRHAFQLHLIGDAETLLTFAQEHSADVPEGIECWEILYDRSVLLFEQGQLSQARDALQVLRGYDLPPELRVRVLSRLGQVLAALSEYDGAILAYQESQRVMVGMPEKDRARQGILANHLGNAYLAKHETGQAEKYFRQALQIFTAQGNLIQQSAAYNNLGNVFSRKEDWNRAIENYRKSLSIKESMNDVFGAATTRLNLGIICLRQARDTFDNKKAQALRAQAEGYFTQAAQTFEQFGARRQWARSIYQLALLNYDVGRYVDAAALIAQAIEVYLSLNLPELTTAQSLSAQINAHLSTKASSSG